MRKCFQSSFTTILLENIVMLYFIVCHIVALSQKYAEIFIRYNMIRYRNPLIYIENMNCMTYRVF